MNKSFDPEQNLRQSQLPKVLVIGGGITGILSANYLKDISQLTIYEYKKNIGGAWMKEDKTENDFTQEELNKNVFYQNYKALPCSIYDNLQVNSPAHTMAFKGYPFKKGTQDFPTQEQVLEYVQNYSKDRNLNKYIQTNTFVQKVRLTKNLKNEDISCYLNLFNEQGKNQFLNELKNPLRKFMVQSCQSDDQNKINIEFYDTVICCSGHQYVPNYPKEVKGFDSWDGSMSHSHTFRHKDMDNFKNKTILVYGFMLTAQDILMILTKQTVENKNRAKKIIWVGNKTQMKLIQKNSESYRQELNSGFLQLEGGRITEFLKNKSVVLNNNKVIENIDHVLLCTGYQSHYPFLDDRDGLIEFYNKEGKHNAFGPLYNFMFSINEPSFVFIGLLDGVITVSYVERQLLYVKQVLDGTIKLPEKSEMLEEFNKHKQQAFKVRSDGSALLRFAPQKMSELKYNTDLFQQQKDVKEFDEFHNEIIFKKFLPLFMGCVINGNYPDLKSQKFSKGLPEIYAPDKNKF